VLRWTSRRRRTCSSSPTGSTSPTRPWKASSCGPSGRGPPPPAKCECPQSSSSALVVLLLSVVLIDLGRLEAVERLEDFGVKRHGTGSTVELLLIV
jgi:hypothetical protein